MARLVRSEQVWAAALIAPLLVFLLLIFIAPVARLLSLSLVDEDVARSLPLTVAVLKDWTPPDPVPDEAFQALAGDLTNATTGADVVDAATRLNYSEPGFRALLMGSRRQIAAAIKSSPDARTALLKISPKWGETETWAAIKRAGGPLTDFYLLSALDLKHGVDGSIERAPESQSAFLAATQRTFEIALGVTLLAILFGFPFAYFMATTSRRVAAIMMFMILLPFMTAMMVRILAWVILLGRGGVINHGLLSFGITQSPVDLLYNRTGVYIALLHIFVPYPRASALRRDEDRVGVADARCGFAGRAAMARLLSRLPAPSRAGRRGRRAARSSDCLGVFVVPAILGGPREQGLPVLIANLREQDAELGACGSTVARPARVGLHTLLVFREADEVGQPERRGVMSDHRYATISQRASRVSLRVFVLLFCVFLVGPIIAFLPMSVNSVALLHYPIEHVSLRWFQELFASREWSRAFLNSMLIAVSSVSRRRCSAFAPRSDSGAPVSAARC